MKDLWAIVLAAGESKRMKTPKMLLPFRGKTIIQTTIGNIVDSEINNILVVLGAFAGEILTVIEDMPVNHCINDKYSRGMLSSVQYGFRHLPSEYGAALVFPGDQPMIQACLINKVIASYHKSGRGIVVPVWQGRRGHPLLIDNKYRKEIELLDENVGLRALARRYSRDVFEVVSDSPDIIKDIDTKEDYLNEINKTG